MGDPSGTHKLPTEVKPANPGNYTKILHLYGAGWSYMLTLDARDIYSREAALRNLELQVWAMLRNNASARG